MKLQLSKIGATCALALPVLFLILYFSLAVHMRISLGRWPVRIGESPATGLFHFHALSAGILFWLGMVIFSFSPIAAAVFGIFPQTRRFTIYVIVFAGGCLLAFGAIYLAPDDFVRWWRD